MIRRKDTRLSGSQAVAKVHRYIQVPLSMVVGTPQHGKTLRWGNAFSHKSQVGERRSLASYCTSTTTLTPWSHAGISPCILSTYTNITQKITFLATGNEYNSGDRE